METENIFSFHYSKDRIVKDKEQSNNWSLLAAIGVFLVILLIAALLV